jgi:hypothetical protein
VSRTAGHVSSADDGDRCVGMRRYVESGGEQARHESGSMLQQSFCILSGERNWQQRVMVLDGMEGVQVHGDGRVCSER